MSDVRILIGFLAWPPTLAASSGQFSCNIYADETVDAGKKSSLMNSETLLIQEEQVVTMENFENIQIYDSKKAAVCTLKLIQHM